MMAANYARKRIRNYFFRKRTVFSLRLILLRLSVISALLSLSAVITRSLTRTWTEYGAPQPPENVTKSELIEGDIPKTIRELKPDYTGTMEYEDEILHECPICESNIWNLKVAFEDYEISNYFLDMECASCGTFAKAPTPLDRPA